MTSNTRIFGLALLFSLMLNAFALGMIISDKMSKRPFKPGHFLGGHTQMKPGRENIPPRLQALFLDLRETRHKALKAEFSSIRTARLAVRDELRKENYDSQALKEKLTALRQAEDTAAKTAQTLILKTAAELTPEERQALAGIMMAGRRGLRLGMTPMRR